MPAAQHLTFGQLLALRLEGGAAFELGDVFAAKHLGGATRGGDQHFVLRRKSGLQSLAAERLPALHMGFVGRHFQGGLDDARTEPDAIEAGTLGELLEQEGETAGLIAALVASQRVAGPAEGPVGVELAEDMVLVGVQQVDGHGRYGQDNPASRLRVVLTEGGMAQVGEEARRRQILAARSDLHRPFQGWTHAVGVRRRQALPPQPLQQEAARFVGVTQFVSAHGRGALGVWCSGAAYRLALSRKRLPSRNAL